jgi:hypothetical protein
MSDIVIYAYLRWSRLAALMVIRLLLIGVLYAVFHCRLNLAQCVTMEPNPWIALGSIVGSWWIVGKLSKQVR